MDKTKIIMVILLFSLLGFLIIISKPENKEITIYFNGTPLTVSIDGHGQETAEGHNYRTGIGYTMRRSGNDVIINARHNPIPPQPAFDSTAKITFECDGNPCEMIGDTVVLFSLNKGDTVKIGSRLYFLGMKP